jgi:nitrous oxide reductase
MSLCLDGEVVVLDAAAAAAAGGAAGIVAAEAQACCIADQELEKKTSQPPGHVSKEKGWLASSRVTMRMMGLPAL